jgi:hypothetical protein
MPAPYDCHNEDYTDPFVHVRSIVVNSIAAAVEPALLAAILGGKAVEQARAYNSALKLIMDRFPEIDWGGGAKAPSQANDSPKPPTCQ